MTSIRFIGYSASIFCSHNRYLVNWILTFRENVDRYIFEHEANFQNYIIQTDLFDQGGFPDIKQIIKVAKADAFR